MAFKGFLENKVLENEVLENEVRVSGGGPGALLEDAYGQTANEETQNPEFASNSFLNVEGGLP